MKRNPAARSRVSRLFPAPLPPTIPASPLRPAPPSPAHLTTGLVALFGAGALTTIALILSALL